MKQSQPPSVTVAGGSMYTNFCQIWSISLIAAGKNKLSIHLQSPTYELIHRKPMYNISALRCLQAPL